MKSLLQLQFWGHDFRHLYCGFFLDILEVSSLTNQRQSNNEKYNFKFQLNPIILMSNLINPQNGRLIFMNQEC